MQWQTGKQRKTGTSFFLYLKCGAILLLFIFSILIVACSGNINNDASLGNTVVTVTINLNGSNGSPTPPLPEYTCAAWVTNSSPGINTSSQVGVYAKFEHNVNGNPEGVGQAAGTATVLWPDGNTMNVIASTTNDGLAVFSIPTANRSADINKTVLVTVSFTKSGVPPCTVAPDQAAFFSLVLATPTASATAGASPTASPSSTATATASPTVSPTPSPTPSPSPKPSPTPKPDPTHCSTNCH